MFGDGDSRTASTFSLSTSIHLTEFDKKTGRTRLDSTIKTPSNPPIFPPHQLQHNLSATSSSQHSFQLLTVFQTTTFSFSTFQINPSIQPSKCSSRLPPSSSPSPPSPPPPPSLKAPPSSSPPSAALSRLARLRRELCPPALFLPILPRSLSLAPRTPLGSPPE